MDNNTKDLIVDTYYMNLKGCQFNEDICKKHGLTAEYAGIMYGMFLDLFQKKSYRSVKLTMFREFVLRLNTLAVLAGNKMLAGRRDEFLGMIK